MFILYLILLNRFGFCVVVFFFLRSQFKLLVPCFVLLYTFTLSVSVFRVCWRVKVVKWWVGEGRGGGSLKLSNFCTYMKYLYCMPKWSHSRFYEIKLLINISIY